MGNLCNFDYTVLCLDQSKIFLTKVSFQIKIGMYDYTYQAIFDTFNHHNPPFPSLFLYMILEINYKQHFIQAAACATGVDLFLCNSRKHLLRYLLRKTGSYCVYLKRIMFSNCLCSSSCFSSSRVRNIGASYIRDTGPFHNLKSRAFCDFLITSENEFGHFKGQLKRQARVVLRKKAVCDLVQCSAKTK